MNKIFCAVMLAACSASTLAASFPCEKAKTDVERMICASPQLSQLDEELAQAYKKTAVEESYGFAQNFQRQWLKSRNLCKDETCLLDAYENRLRELRLEPLDSHDFLTSHYSFGKGNGYQGYGYLVKVAPDRFRYELYVTSGEPAWHTGGAGGEATIRGKAARTIPSTSTCLLNFKLDDDRVTISQIPGGKVGECPLGASVTLDATFNRATK